MSTSRPDHRGAAVVFLVSAVVFELHERQWAIQSTSPVLCRTTKLENVTARVGRNLVALDTITLNDRSRSRRRSVSASQRVLRMKLKNCSEASRLKEPPKSVRRPQDPDAQLLSELGIALSVVLQALEGSIEPRRAAGQGA